MEIAGKTDPRNRKRKKGFGAKSVIKAVVCSTFVGEPVGEHVRFWGRQFGIEVKIEFTPINTVFEEMLDPNSSFAGNSEGFNILLIRIEDLVSRQRDWEIKESHVVEKVIRELCVAIEKRQELVPLIVGNVPNSPQGITSGVAQGSFAGAVEQLKEACTHCDEVCFIDFEEWIDRYKVSDVFDPIKDAEASVPFTDEFYAVIGTVLARKIRSLTITSGFKVAVLDCDNTLWSGICGEDGWQGVKVTAPYLEAQHFLKQKRKEGLLLALCSKNHENDVWDVFEKRQDMILRREDFVASRINWKPKPDNIQEIGDELKLDIGSFIFVDDDPAECAEMMMVRPEVLTLQLPKELSHIPVLLHHTWAMDKEKPSREDGMRSEMYVAEKKRGERRSQAMSLEEYRAELGLRVDMQPIGESDYRRAAQLTQRTTQFNMNGRVYDASALKEVCSGRNVRAWSVHAEDRFGEFGMVGVVMGEEGAGTLEIQIFLLSCRVLSREIEWCVLEGLKKYCEESVIETIKMGGVATDRNKPFFEFLDRMREGGIASLREQVVSIETRDVPPSPEYIEFLFLNQREETREHEEQQKDQKCRLHHIGVAVEDVMTAKETLSRIGYEVSDSVSDASLGVDLALARKHGHPTIELVKRAEKTGLGRDPETEDAGTAYHVCFEVESIEEVVTQLAEEEVNFFGLEDPKPAKLFDNRRVGFFYVDGFGLVELLEGARSRPPGWGEIGDEGSLVRVFVDEAGNTFKFLEALGYRQVKSRHAGESRISSVTFYSPGGYRIEMVTPMQSPSQAGLSTAKECEGLQIVSLVRSIDGTRKWFADQWGDEMYGRSLPSWEIVDHEGGGRELAYTKYVVFAEEGDEACDERMKRDCSFPVYNREKLRHLSELLPLRFCSGKLLAGIVDDEDSSGLSNHEEERDILAIEFDL